MDLRNVQMKQIAIKGSMFLLDVDITWYIIVEAWFIFYHGPYMFFGRLMLVLRYNHVI